MYLSKEVADRDREAGRRRKKGQSPSYQRQVMAMKLGLAIAYKLPMNVLRKKK
jgi:hypothetical protein